MSIRVTLHCPLNSSSPEALMGFLEENLPAVRGFNGCRRVSVLMDEQRQEMLLDEEWQSQQHHRDYLAFIEGNGVMAKLSEFMAGPPQVRYLKSLDI